MTINANIFYNADAFSNMCMPESASGSRLTNDDLLLDDFFISELRQKEKINDFNTSLFYKTFDEIVQSKNDLRLIRSTLLIFAVKNIIDINYILGYIISEDIVDLDNLDIQYRDEIYSKYHKIFNKIFFNELSKHPFLMLDVIESMRCYYSKKENQQFEKSYYIIHQLILANEESLTPLSSSKLLFIKEEDISDKYLSDIYNTYPIILPYNMKYKDYLKLMPPKIELSFQVDRKDVLKTVWALNAQNKTNGYFKIKFRNEDGIDCGGLTKEFIELAFKEIIKPENDFFEVRNNYYFFKHHVYEDENQRAIYREKYLCIGILFGLVIQNKLTIPFHFPPYFYKKLLHRNITLSDFRCFDHERLIQYQRMMDRSLTKDSMVDYTYRDSLSYREIDLVNFQIITTDDYKPTPLTDENKDTYIGDVLKWIFIISVYDEFKAFEKGFNMVKNDPFFYHSFRLDELDRLVSGVYHRNWDEFKKATRYNGYTNQSKTIVWFWKYFDKLDEDGKLNVMKFIRASTSIPPGGMKDIHIKINKTSNLGLPMAHTCFEELDLPEYKSFKDLKDKCDLALSYTDYFGMK